MSDTENPFRCRAYAKGARALEGLEDVRHGVRAARRAGFRAEDVVNTLGPEAFEAWLRARR